MRIRLTKDLPLKGMDKGKEFKVIRQTLHSLLVEAPNGFRITLLDANTYEEVKELRDEDQTNKDGPA